MNTADHELFAALQGDVADERQVDVVQLEAEVLRLKRGLMHEVLDRAGFHRTDDPAVPYRRVAGLSLLGPFPFPPMPLTPDEARDRLASYGIPVTFIEEQPA